MKQAIQHTLLLAGLTLLFFSSAMFPVPAITIEERRTASPAAAQTTVHALLIIMDEDKSIGGSCKVDQYYIENLLTSLEVAIGCTVQKKILLGSNGTATLSQIRQALSEISPTSEDTVFVYYSGHGA